MAVHQFADGMWLDHIAWGVPDTVAGVEQLRELTGAEMFAPGEPEAGQWYLSAGLPFQDGRFLEVIGPAPGVTGHPLGDLLRSLQEPRLLFWFLRVENWDDLARRTEAVGRPLSRIEEVDDERFHSYRRAGIGPGLDPVMPNVIEWRRRRPGSTDDGVCRISDFRLGHPDPSSINAVLAALGTDMTVAEAARSTLTLELSTPNGVVRLDGIGNPIDGT